MVNLNYGIVGNCRSAALISETGAIDWFCLPDFASASVFAALLDQERGGRFSIDPGDSATITQTYVKHTNILQTRFETADGCFDVFDFMPRYKNDRRHYVCPSDLIRYIRPVSGRPKIRLRYQPALRYGEHETHTEIHADYVKSWCDGGTYESIYLYTDLPFQSVLDGEELVIDTEHFLLVTYNQKLLHLTPEDIHLEYERTKVYWLEWVKRTVRFVRYQEEIVRSALTLKLLSFQKSGAILAAVTTSLPETIGEVRNWDYRFCWIRDASMIITVLTNLGHYNAAERFLRFVLDVIPYKDEKIQIMYGIRGEKTLTERELPWLSGYEHSQPVRIGNAAYIQKQNDIYGVLLDVIHKAFDLFPNDLERGEDLWTTTRSLVRTVQRTWREPDMGIWEFRSQKKHFVFSKMLSWVALDRGVKMADLLGKTSYSKDWARTRDAIRADIMEKGWNEQLGAFTQAYENQAMDAANLLMATYGFIDPMDPRYISTVDRIREELCQDGLMFRYRNPDDFGSPSSAFTVCSFWLVKSLCLIGRKKEARAMFQHLLGCANHLGLFSEDLDFKTRRLLGNFPQGYSHLALIDAAILLSETEVEEDDKIMNRIEHFADIQRVHP
ncbi:MAG: glycoside hydrolase family 15 protein [Lentisphaeria bacterium]|nr:glycoside hydrolase family 15 protein [Lentisphaeria bacterium]